MAAINAHSIKRPETTIHLNLILHSGEAALYN